MVSVLVPVYNVAPYIERCARSLFLQTYDNCEFIFIDDCSPDDSIKILNNVINDFPKLKDRINIIRHTTNKGLAAARNTALLHANGEFIIHVDSDDYLEINAIEELHNAAIEFDADFVFPDFNFIYKKKQFVYYDGYNDDKFNYLSYVLTRKRLVNIIGKLIRKKIIIENKLWEIEGLNQGEDYLMTPRIIYYANNIKKVNRPLYNYNRSNISSYTSNFNEKGVDDLIEVQEQLIIFFSNIPDATKYKNIINLSKIYNKITLLYNAPLHSYAKIARLYPECETKSYNISIKHRGLLFLIDHGFYKLSYNIIKAVKKWK